MGELASCIMADDEDNVRASRGPRLQRYDWKSIAEKHASAVWQTAYRLLRNQADFELSQRQRLHNVRALLLRLATTRAIDQLRRRMRQSRPESDGDDGQHAVSSLPAPDAEAQNLELAERLRAAIAQLPSQEAKVFCLRYFSSLSYREISGELQITTGTADVVLRPYRRPCHRRPAAAVDSETAVRAPGGSWFAYYTSRFWTSKAWSWINLRRFSTSSPMRMLKRRSASPASSRRTLSSIRVAGFIVVSQS